MTSTYADVHAVDACPISPLIEVVFSRWTTPILWGVEAPGTTAF